MNEYYSESVTTKIHRNTEENLVEEYGYVQEPKGL